MPGWLTARPVAHRGLHDASSGAIENNAAAFKAAIAGNYAIECDIQISADGEAMVHHDDALGRLTDGTGNLRDKTAAELKRVAFKATADRMLTLGELCDLTADRVALMIEIKSRAQRFQVQTIMTGEVPPQYMPQIQFGLLVTGRKWCDYVSYCAGLPMVAIRVLPDDRWQEQLRKAAADFEAAVKRVIADYRMWLGRLRHVQTERKIEQEIGI